ncbi:glycoside hydrolase family 25 protein [Streptomyces gilvosporeus]|uniref:Muramidase n=1 Tax=Streptomyces gilvosporeus TaxID=553510 RepID=A0A1V0U261_9ACTN|nr:glycoside hydrolase family 25 protein [Streptomyces gilvosporeus]ARF59120.1 muramidase [Streptomyces gilvosporeus]
MLKGIDVSSNNESFSISGMDFVIVKATEGHTVTNPKQKQQAAIARSAGLVVGFYQFLWPGNVDAQAQYFVEQCDSHEEDILAVDWETTTSGTRASSDEKDAILRKIKALRPNHRVILYCNRDFWLHHDTSSYAGDGLWIADYDNPPGHPHITAPWLIHQYTSKPLDTNVARFDSRAAMSQWASGTTVHTPA